MKFLLSCLRPKRLLLLAAALLLLAAALAVQTAPALPMPGAMSALEIAQGRDFLRRNDPRRQYIPFQPTRRIVDISELELNLALAQLARKRPQTALGIALQPGEALLKASLAVPATPLWLNLSASLAEGPGATAEVQGLRVGRLPVPAALANWLLQRELARHAEARLLAEMVEDVSFARQRLRIGYRWQADSMARVMTSLWPAADQQRARGYHEHLRRIIEQRFDPKAPSVSLAELLPPMFERVREQTALGGEAAAENRVALLTLALYASGKEWGALLPAAREWARLPARMVTLAGREDFPQHLLVSAVIAIEGGGPLADAVGVYKEVADARTGSGFSFNDIAADRAGARIGVLATQAPLRLQSALIDGLKERDFMPDVSDLPEFLREQDFVQRYGRIGSPAYRETMASIEARLDAIELLR